MWQSRHLVDGQLYPILLYGKPIPDIQDLCYINGRPNEILQVIAVEVTNNGFNPMTVKITAENNEMIVTGDFRHFTFEYENGLSFAQDKVDKLKDMKWDRNYDLYARDNLTLRDWPKNE